MCIVMHIKYSSLLRVPLTHCMYSFPWHISQVHTGRLTVVVHIARSIVLSLSSHIFHRVYSNRGRGAGVGLDGAGRPEGGRWASSGWVQGERGAGAGRVLVGRDSALRPAAPRPASRRSAALHPAVPRRVAPRRAALRRVAPRCAASHRPALRPAPHHPPPCGMLPRRLVNTFSNVFPMLSHTSELSNHVM